VQFLFRLCSYTIAPVFIHLLAMTLSHDWTPLFRIQLPADVSCGFSSVHFHIGLSAQITHYSLISGNFSHGINLLR
jgi:hypothetical protein